MELLDACARLGALAPHLLDAEVRRSIETLAARAPDVEPIPGSDDAEELLYAVTDEVIRLGEEFDRLGRVDDLILARRIVVELVRPQSESRLADFANALGMLAWILAGQGRHAEALELAEECAAVLRPHAADDFHRQGMYARAIRDCGTNLAALGRIGEAAAAKRQALEYYQHCLVDNPRFAVDILLTCHEQSDLLLRCGEHAEVLTVCDTGLTCARTLLPTLPDADCGFQVAMLLRDRASALLWLDRVDEAVDDCLQAVARLRRIADEHVGHLTQLALALNLVSDPLSQLGRHDEALTAAAEAVEMAGRLDDDQQMTRSLTRWTYGRRLLEHGRLTEAKDAYLAAVPGSEDFREGFAPELYRLAEVLFAEGLLSEAASVLTVAARLFKLLAAADSDWAASYARLLGRLAEVDFTCGRHESALRWAERAVSAAEKSGDRETIALAMGHLGSSLAGADRHEEAERAARDALGRWQELCEEDPRHRPNVAGAWNNLANKLRPLGLYEEAVTAAQQAVALYERADEPHELANALNSLGAHLAPLGLAEQAREAARRSVGIYDRLVVEERKHLRELAIALGNLSGYHAGLGELDEAWAAADRALTIRHRLWLLDPAAVEPDLLASARAASDYATRSGRAEEAAYANAIRVEVFEAREEPGVELAEALADLAGSLTGTPRLREAAEAAERGASLLAAMPEVPGLRAFCLDRLAWCHAQLGRPGEAVRLARRGAALLEPIAGDDHDPHLPELGVLLCDLAGYLLACARPVEALDAATRAVAVRERLHARGPGRFGGDLAEALRRLGDALAALGRGQAADEARLRAAGLTGPVRDDAPAGETYEGCTAADLAGEYDRLEGTAEHRPEISRALNALAGITAGLAVVPAGGPDRLALSLSDLAGALCLRGRPDDEAEVLRVVVALREVTQEPMTGELALSVGRLGSALNRAGRSAEAAPASLRAVAMLEGLVVAGHPGLRHFLAQAYEDAGHALSRLGEPEDAAARLRQAAETYDDLAAEDPQYRDLLARASGALGELLTGLGDLAGASGAYERAVGLYLALLAEGRTAVRADLRRALTSAARTRDRAGDTAGSLAFAREAIGLLEQAVLVDADARPALAALLEAAVDGLAEIGDDENAAGVALRAADVARRLPEEEGAAARAGWCLVLAGLARCRLGETGEGLDLLRRAVALLDAAGGTDVLPDLGQALHMTAVMSSGDEAYGAAERAVACYRRLDRETPGTWRRALVLTLVLLARRAAETERWRAVADAAEETIPDLLENAPDDERAREVLRELLDDYRTAIVRLDIPDTRLAYAEAALRRLSGTPVATGG
ncbi:tetratricopeptide repeat protein [Microbispora sp. H10836]|uniref:tetratricopeptide repeat protein n=1 Tax=Microbispora sp. H10836 TaxID=2729106 RepID=UPI001472B613|nr:tetratricopeptide repeat protein [Microbispora sp. H10836]